MDANSADRLKTPRLAASPIARPVPRHADHLRARPLDRARRRCGRLSRSWPSRRCGSRRSCRSTPIIAMFGGVGKGGMPVLDYFRNSLIISVTSTVIAIVIGMAGGYAFARYRFRGKSACSSA